MCVFFFLKWNWKTFRDWSIDSVNRPGFKRVMSFTTSEGAGHRSGDGQQKSAETGRSSSSSLLPPVSGTGGSGNKPVKSASFNIRPPPPRRLSWFSSNHSGTDSPSRSAAGVKPGRTKARTLSIDQGTQRQQRQPSSSPDSATEDEATQQQSLSQPQSPFGVFNHLRSSFKHYTNKNRHNKDVGWRTRKMTGEKRSM